MQIELSPYEILVAATVLAEAANRPGLDPDTDPMVEPLRSASRALDRTVIDGLADADDPTMRDAVMRLMEVKPGEQLD